MSDMKILVPLMKGMIKELKEDKQEINDGLEVFNIQNVNTDHIIHVLDQQVRTANNKFTMAFVGEFKSGKSTIINTLLELSGDQRLSSELDPDTAKCIRILYKTKDMDYDAEIIYIDGPYENEKTSWTDAKKYTSQVALNNDETLKDKAAYIDEVRYYVKNSVLETCNILDLPGTGAGGHTDDHTFVTNKKILETDAIFWVVSTAEEPGQEAVSNLEKFKDKIIPLINVWQFKEDNIEGMCTLEEVETLLKEKYSVYFSDEVAMISYYAKEIDVALERGEDIPDEWGKKAFSECVQNVFGSESFNRELGKINRIKRVLKDEFSKLNMALDDTSENLVAYLSDIGEEKTDLDSSLIELESINRYAATKVKDSCKHMSNDIINYMTDQTECFIEDEMQAANLKIIFKGIKKDKKDELIQKMTQKYKDEYLKLEEKPSWYDHLIDQLTEEISVVLNSEYARFAIKSSERIDVKKEIDIDNDIISGIITQSIRAAMESIGNVLMLVITGIVLYLIPGGAIVDAIAISFFGGTTLNKDTLSKKKENIKARGRLSIKMQRHAIGNDVHAIGKNINNDVYKKIQEKILDQKSEADQSKARCQNTLKKVKELIDQIATYETQLSKF
jgi:hypothetical protein